LAVSQRALVSTRRDGKTFTASRRCMLGVAVLHRLYYWDQHRGLDWTSVYLDISAGGTSDWTGIHVRCCSTAAPRYQQRAGQLLKPGATSAGVPLSLPGWWRPLLYALAVVPVN
jgi:hypothetical protein